MLHFLSPSWLKKADRFSKGVKKFIAYQRDLIPDAKMAEVTETKAAYDAALKARDREALEGLEKKLLKVCEGAVPNYNASPLKENVEVIIVAVVVALGIRAYYLQPFKIPTASMQPTLNGIIATRLDENQATPNFLLQGLQYAWNGRNYVNWSIPKDWTGVSLTGYQQRSKANFFTFTTLYFSNGQTESIYAPAKQLLKDLCHVSEVTSLRMNMDSDDNPQVVYFADQQFDQLGRPMNTADGRPVMQPKPIEVQPGQLFARGFIESGDQLLVDKMSYHFRRPHRDDVFVFSTDGIKMIGKNQHYIKRLTAVPGDRLAVEPPVLLINGKKTTGKGSLNVINQEGDYATYKGYSMAQPPGGGQWFVGLGDGNRSDEVTLGPKEYMAMGDNSYNSFDSRNWGPVQEKNIVGPALLVYWPFANHWGIIR